MKKVTISVRKVTAYAVVRTIETESLGGVETILEAADATRAIEVASALAAQDPNATLDLDEEAWANARATQVGQPRTHASDCAVHNEPAYPAGPCNCGAELTARRKSRS